MQPQISMKSDALETLQQLLRSLAHGTLMQQRARFAPMQHAVKLAN